MLLSVVHNTVYHYDCDVDSARHMLHLEPVSSGYQSVCAFDLEISPGGVDALHRRKDIYGNAVTFFEIHGRHRELSIQARSQVQTHVARDQQRNRVQAVSWEDVAQRFRYRKAAPWDSASEFVHPSEFVQPHPDFQRYALQSMQPTRPFLEGAIELMHRLHQDMRYVAHSTEVHTPALEAFIRREGVCQDFAHILIACFRTLGLPARYVSGYLLTHPPEGQPRMIGADASHAWVAVYVPQADEGFWVDLDPTNDRWGLGSLGEDVVVLAHGRDYADISPVRGVIHGGADHRMEVSVTVEPLDSLLGGPAAIHVPGSPTNLGGRIRA